MTKLTTTEFIKKAKAVHGEKYDYSKSVYAHSKQKLIIICLKHGEFHQSPNPHLKGAGCPGCKKEVLSKLYSNSLDDFIISARKKHGQFYDYSNVEYISNKIPVDIICPVHGVFKQRPDSHCNGKGCNKCKKSHQIRDIIHIFEEKGIKHVLEHKFDNCRNILPLPFDIFIDDLNLCIEYDGRQHFEPVEHWGGIDGLEYVKQNDLIKNQYCDDNNINLLRIRYDENHISVLKEYFKNNFNIEL
jgi:hypothetical protein